MAKYQSTLATGETITADTSLELVQKIQARLSSLSDGAASEAAARELSSFGAHLHDAHKNFVCINTADKGQLQLPVYKGLVPAEQEWEQLTPPSCHTAVKHMYRGAEEHLEWLRTELDRLEAVYSCPVTRVRSESVSRLADGRFSFEVAGQNVAFLAAPYKFYTCKDHKKLLAITVIYCGRILFIHANEPLQLV